MKKFIISASLVLLGIVIGFPLFSMTYYTMVRTSTPHFCASCHEIQFAYNTWRTSTHVNNAQGFVADCMDCHLPAPEDTISFFFTKTAHGIRDVFLHFTQDTYDHEKNREKAYASFKNEQCQKCHRNILYIPAGVIPEMLTDTTLSIIIAEGAKKALSFVSDHQKYTLRLLIK